MQEKSRKPENSKSQPKTQDSNQAELHEAFVDTQNNCPLCATELVIEVDIGDNEFTLKEQAKCPACDLVARVKDHGLH
ncbi:MAG: hypothetical protein HRT45_02455 [Bdellovibrionales bacterium]|nr:hypothetical protein [Bdellovibrionales bacterium]